MEFSKRLTLRTLIAFPFITLLACITGCSSGKPVATQKQPDIISIYASEGDKIKALGNGWFEVTGKAIIQNITPEEAQEQAIRDACRAVIEHYSLEISGRTLDLQAESQKKIILEHFASLIEQTTRGRILEKHVIRKEIKTDGVNLMKVVVLKVKVGRHKGERDPYFNVTAHLNKEKFKVGEKLELTVQSSKDCYISVLNICPDDSVYMLFPNQHRRNNFLEAEKFFKLPNEADTMKGVSVPARLRKGKDRGAGIIKILATKKNMSFPTSQTLSAYGTYELALKKLLHWLIKIPRNEMEEYDMHYLITK